MSLRGPRLVSIPPGLALEVDAVGVVNDAVEYGVGDHGFADYLVPLINRDLACDEDKFAPVALFHVLHQVASSFDGEVLETPVVEGQPVGLGCSKHRLRASVGIPGGYRQIPRGSRQGVSGALNNFLTLSE